jgi:hypothetical protein
VNSSSREVFADAVLPTPPQPGQAFGPGQVVFDAVWGRWSGEFRPWACRLGRLRARASGSAGVGARWRVVEVEQMTLARVVEAFAAWPKT